nr:MAG TPA: hypothetical protein [Caudoviricetes sp.]
MIISENLFWILVSELLKALLKNGFAFVQGCLTDLTGCGTPFRKSPFFSFGLIR